MKLRLFLAEHLNWRLRKIRPRPATRFAKDYFKGKPITVIEIGTSRGDHAKQILKNLNVEKIYLIDPWREYEDYLRSEHEQTQSVLNKNLEDCKKKLRRWEESGKIVYIKDFSDNAISRVPNADYIYIDGNHEYKYALSDIKNYFLKVNGGGILAGDDIGHPGVNKALIEFCYKNKLNFQCEDRDWWIIK
ncbi:MAG: class I SAM-dependent methyltransferase [Candidatus Pacearchaeota archaeon]|nr:class I SAM-dependent methyltransferase [Candidatus Pacearchaeota archaeon]